MRYSGVLCGEKGLKKNKKKKKDLLFKQGKEGKKPWQSVV